MPELAEHQVLPWAEVRAILLARSSGRCEVCGWPLRPERWDGHHRQPRSAGGPDCPCNGLALHPLCHTLSPHAVHQRPEWARQRGFIVPRWGDPRVTMAEVPAAVSCLGPVVSLTCGGTYA